MVYVNDGLCKKGIWRSGELTNICQLSGWVLPIKREEDVLIRICDCRVAWVRNLAHQSSLLHKPGEGKWLRYCAPAR